MNLNDLQHIQEKFKQIFHLQPYVTSRAPGRAEIIGNHTDYNHGFALGAAISQSTYTAVSHRNDDQIALYSANFDQKIHTFPISDIDKKQTNHWTNYVKAVVCELSRKIPYKKGFNMYIRSDVPSLGGVSSSAALELSIGLSLQKLYKIDLSMLELAALCQKAENGPLVNSPCGFLDQAACALSKKNRLLFLDFFPKNGLLISEYKYVPIDLSKHDASFLIVVDKKIKRNLGESGYPARRQQCEQSLPLLSNLTGRKIASLRDISIAEFKLYKNKLEKADTKMRMRVEHITYENQRVLDAVKALKYGDINLFGKLLTASGKSALELYELDEKTPELTYLLSQASQIEGVIGARNMGGGFSANILVLLKNSHLDSFSAKLSTMYMKKYYNKLDFISFQPAQGASIIWQSE